LIAAIVRSPRKGAESARIAPRASANRGGPVRHLANRGAAAATDRLDDGKESNENETSANGATTFSNDAHTSHPRG